jgi:hypothetical protein
VATTGSGQDGPWAGRRVTAALTAVLAAAGLALAAAGCGSGGRATGTAATPQPRPEHALSGGPGSQAGPGGTDGHGRAAGPPGAGSAAGAAAGPVLTRFCPQPAGPELRAALRDPVPASLRGEIVPLGLSASGRAAYVSTWQPRFAGVAVLDLATGRMRPIQRYRHPAVDQADGAASGRWLVWEQTRSLQSLDGFTVYAWDSVTGRVRAIGHSGARLDGSPWPSPWRPPAVSGHWAAWAQGYGPGGLVEIRLADLATGRVRVIRQGHTQAPFFDGSLVVWPESGRPGAQTTLHAMDLRTGQPAALPAVLRPVHGTDFVATDGVRTAYLNPGLTALWYSPAQDQPAREVLRLPDGTDFASLAISPGSLAWATTEATYVASTATGGFAKVTRQYGVATGSPSGLLISDGPAAKSAHPVLPLHVVAPAAVRQPACG